MKVHHCRRASDDYYQRVDMMLETLGLARISHVEGAIVDGWSCFDFSAEDCAQYIANQRMIPSAPLFSDRAP
jgi:hypothetical protein